MDRHRRHLARSAIRATIPKACASAARASTAARSRSGKSASSRISTTPRELGTRNIKVALRRLRRFAREGAADELDLDATIDGTAQAGLARHPHAARAAQCGQAAAVPRRRRLDGPASSSWCEELFSAATTEFKNLEFFYFHNCLYEGVWKDNRRRFTERTPTWDMLHKYGHDYKVIFVGDASMSPYEISHPGGSVEHFNEEAGAVWLQRVTNTYPATVWLNPVPEKQWDYSQLDQADPAS